ncbi:hypothetical protein BGZ68_004039 [Mortierella alpina]|nr:hypothetical protein BGZ68_004039 [Mortierella alpina]
MSPKRGNKNKTKDATRELQAGVYSSAGTSTVNPDMGGVGSNDATVVSGTTPMDSDHAPTLSDISQNTGSSNVLATAEDPELSNVQMETEDLDMEVDTEPTVVV